MINGNGVKALTESSLNGIQAIPRPGQMRVVGNSLVVRLGGKTDDAPNWWQVHAFDKYTESLWTPPGEPFLAGAIATVASQYSARTYFIDGPKRIVNATTTMLESADQGRGMVSLFLKTVQDLKGRCNGAFWFLMRDGVNFSHLASVKAIEYYKPAEKALELAARGKLPPVTTIEHLDSGQCFRTGNPLYPVWFVDAESERGLFLPWHMCVAMTELPFPVSKYRGIQLSAVARVMRAAQIMIAKQTYKLEKITGRNPEDIHFISGVNREETKDQIAYSNEEADNEGLVRWQDAAMVFGINPERPISIATLSAKSDSAFDDIDKEMQWYITAVTDNFLETYQMLAPLQAGGLGNSQQSIILADAAQGKGPALWEKMISQIMHQYAIVPRNCEWRWGEKSIRYEKDVADLIAVQLDNYTKLKRDLEVPKEVVYQIMVDDGVVLTDEYLAMLGERDVTDDVTVADDEQQPDTDVQPVEVIERVEVDANATLKALSILHRSYKASEAEGLIAEFSEAIHSAVSGYIEGTYTKRVAQNAFVKAINEAWPAMGEVAYEVGGGDWSEVEEDDASALEDAAIAQVAYAVNFWDSLPDIKEEGSEPDARVELYVNSLRGLYADYKARGMGNPMLTLNLGDAEEHCEDKDGLPGCLNLAGKRYSRKKWAKMGVTPGTPGSATVCGGFNCTCYHTTDDGERFDIEKSMKAIAEFLSNTKG